MNFEPIIALATSLIGANSSCSSTSVMAMFSLHSNIDTTRLSMQVWQRAIHLTTRFARGSVAGLTSTLCLQFENASLWQPYFCTRPYSSDQSWMFRTCCRVHALRVRTWTMNSFYPSKKYFWIINGNGRHSIVYALYMKYASTDGMLNIYMYT